MPHRNGHTHLSTPKSLFQKLAGLERKFSTEAKPADVHHLRTTSRRLETLLTAHEDQLGGVADKVVKQLGRLRRKAGRVRDFDVQTDALRAISIESIARDKARLISDLESSRQKREKKLLSVVAQELDSTMRKRMQKAEVQLSQLSNEQPVDYSMLALDKFSVLADKYPVLTEDNLHPFRIALKRVRYLAELGKNGAAATVVSECKRAQDSIGDWHDMVMLTNRAERLFAKKRAPIIAVLRTNRSTKLAEAFRTSVDVRQKLLKLHAERCKSSRPELVPESWMIAAAS